jgi:hypothetical protein
MSDIERVYYYPDYANDVTTALDPVLAGMVMEIFQTVARASSRQEELSHAFQVISKDFEEFRDSQNKADTQQEKAFKGMMFLIELAGKNPQIPGFLDKAYAAYEKFLDQAPDYQGKAIEFLHDRYEHNR